MKKLLVIIAALALSGCAQWNELSDQEKAAWIVSGAILVGVNVLKNTDGDTTVIENKTCVSTRSIQTGCGNVDL